MTQLLLIGAAAEQAGVASGTVRDYCRLGLLNPLRDSAGRRLFTPQDVTRIKELYLERMARRPVPTGGRK